eukprot:m.474661 g.474661  ORF g.474661 m.474661 type:complete len:51 (-) comp21678_c0_seq6:577-729(-)
MFYIFHTHQIRFNGSRGTGAEVHGDVHTREYPHCVLVDMECPSDPFAMGT